MRIAVRDHQNKALGLIKALEQVESVDLVAFGQPADVLLIDHDGTEWYKRVIRAYKRHGARVLLYTHGAPAWLAWDGVYDPDPMVDGYLAMSPGERETMRRYGYNKPIAVTGFYWCEQKKFKPWDGIERTRVLYAPSHALSNGYIHEDVLGLNKAVLERLAGIKNIDLTVRFIGKMQDSGIEHINGVSYKQGRWDNSTDDIDNFDCVVSYGTFLHLAVARGKPTLGYRYDLPYFDGHSDESIRYAESWDKYANLMRYPYDIIEDDLDRANRAPEVWRQTWIGDQITPERVLECLNILIPTARLK